MRMEREFKFRAWHNETEQMLFVGDSFGTKHPLDCVNYARQGQDVVLMQYVGLKDKNGKEIYESDILEDSSGNRWVVEWYNDHACFGVRCETVFSEIIDNLNMRVIGNVFQHPELINKATS